MRKIISYMLKAIVVISSVVGVALFAIPGTDGFMGAGTTFMYFTIQSNIAIAAVALIGIIMMILKKRYRQFEIIQLVFTVSISLTGLVFCIMLAPTFGASAFVINNVLTHIISPVAAVADFFVEERKYALRKRDVTYVIIPPICYVIYAGIGYASNWDFGNGVNYPYYFLNWGSPAGAFKIVKEAPYLGTVYYILILAGVVVGLGFLYRCLGNLSSKKSIKEDLSAQD